MAKIIKTIAAFASTLCISMLLPHLLNTDLFPQESQLALSEQVHHCTPMQVLTSWLSLFWSLTEQFFLCCKPLSHQSIGFEAYPLLKTFSAFWSVSFYLVKVQPSSLKYMTLVLREYMILLLLSDFPTTVVQWKNLTVQLALPFVIETKMCKTTDKKYSKVRKRIWGLKKTSTVHTTTPYFTGVLEALNLWSRECRNAHYS